MSDEFKVQWTVSLPPVAQYAKGHMFNFRGETVDELNAIFDEVLASETLDKAISVASLLCGMDNVQNAGNEPAVRSVPTQNDEPTNVSTIKTCSHGKRTYRSGEKNGKAWAGWFCPERNRSAQCDAVWEDHR